jgi:hypothetical protein
MTSQYPLRSDLGMKHRRYVGRLGAIRAVGDERGEGMLTKEL